MTRYWIFDFDGTLIDSEIAIKECYIKITQDMAPNRIKVAQNILIGPTLNETSTEILGSEYIHLLSKFKRAFQEEYDKETIFKTLIYTNANTVLKNLFDRGDKMAIATNKRYSPTQSLIKHYGWNDFFEWVACINQSPNYKKKPDMLKEILAKYPSFQKSFFVGDTVNDGITANSNNLKFIRAIYGYGGKEDWSSININGDITDIIQLLDL